MQVMALRGGLVETAHPVHAVAIRDGIAAPVLQTGPVTYSPWRSASKPLQTWGSLEALGPTTEAALTEADLALGSSSHSGEPAQVAGVRDLLARLGVEEDWLRCGAEPPMHAPTRRALERAEQPPLPIHNDCSGKHALMLGACVQRSWSLDYLPAAHPLQRRLLALATDWCGERPGLAVDGCGVPTFYLSVAGMARAWARLAAAMQVEALDARLHRIGWAMARHPELVSGEGRIDLAVARRAAEPLVGKIGADGVFCVALPARRLGVAMKVVSGNEHALAVAIPAVLEAVAPGCLRPDPAWPWAMLRNVVGREVGQWVAAGLSRAYLERHPDR